MRDLVFVDLETTGLDPHHHEIIEVAAVRVDGETLEERRVYKARMMPRFPERFSAEAMSINGYDMLEWRITQTPREQVIVEMEDILHGAGLSAHNLAFETGFLTSFFRGHQPWHHHGVCTQTLVMPLVRAGLLTSASLAAACHGLGIEPGSSHVALDDARASLALARRLLPLYGAAVAADMGALVEVTS